MFDHLKQTEYIGANRCLPCTAANVAILAGLCLLAAVVTPIGAVLLAIVGVTLIFFRGYFVPFTPRFGPSLKAAVSSLRSRPLDPEHDSLAIDDISGETVLDELRRADIVSIEGEELALSPAFEEAWNTEMRAARDLSLCELGQWAVTLLEGTAIEDVEAVDDPWMDPYLAVTFESGEQAVLDYPVAVAELSAIAVLDDAELGAAVQLGAAGPLRGFLDSCPVCDTTLEQSRYAGCCGNPRADEERLGSVCPTCRSVLYKLPE
jgi:hypothetical protein